MKFVSILLLSILCFSIHYEGIDIPTCKLHKQSIAENDSFIAKYGFDIVSKSIEEPTLPSQNQDVYRLIKSSAFWEVGKEVYTLTKENGAFYLKVKYIQKGSVVLNKKMKVREKEWKEFDDLVQEKCFWAMSCFAAEPTLDGTVWLLEAYSLHANKVSNRNYHIVTTNTYSFRYNMDFEVLCRKMVAFYDCED